MNYYLKKHWKTNTLVCLSKILGSALEVGQNLILIGLFQSVVDGRKDAFLSYALTLLALCAAQIAWGHFTTWLTSRAKMAMNNHYRADLAASLLAMDHTAFHSRDTGEYLSWYTNDVNQISTLAWDSVFSLVELAFQVVFSAVALAMMHWSLLAASLAVTLVTLTAPKFLGRGVEPVSQACTAQQAQATGKFKDLLSGLDVLVAFGRKKRFVEENNAASRQMEQPRHNLTCKQDFASREIGMVSVFCQLSLLLLIGLLSLNGQLIEAALTGGTNLAGGVTGGLSAIGQYLVAIRASKPYFEKVTVRSSENGIAPSCGAQPVTEGIVLEDISFAYGDKPILRNASFRFTRGGKYALTGSSGCGKSTVLKLLLGWLPDYQGTITLDGKDTRTISQDALLGAMSYIEQDVFLFNTTIRDNITLGETFSREQLEKAIRGSALDTDLKSMPQGLDTPVGEDGSALSGGQKQRVAIARALLHDRSILLVDEGTSALDAHNADIVEKSLLANPDLTLILVSHHLSEERKAQFTQVYRLSPA